MIQESFFYFSHCLIKRFVGKVWKGAWRWYHEDMLECCFSLNAVKTVGITMDGLSSIARCNQLESQIVYADDELTAEILR